MKHCKYAIKLKNKDYCKTKTRCARDGAIKTFMERAKDARGNVNRGGSSIFGDE